MPEELTAMEIVFFVLCALGGAVIGGIIVGLVRFAIHRREFGDWRFWE